MAYLDFSPGEYMKIENENQFEKIYPHLRRNYIYWNGEYIIPKFPLYFEDLGNGSGGYTHFPNDEFKIKSFEEAYKE